MCVKVVARQTGDIFRRSIVNWKIEKFVLRNNAQWADLCELWYSNLEGVVSV